MKKTFIILFGFISVLTVYGRQVPVDVVKQNTEVINAEVNNIQPNTVIDITTPFSDTDKINAENGLNLTDKEKTAFETVLNGGTLNSDQIDDYISALNKQTQEKTLSSDEKKLLTGLNGDQRDARDNTKFLARKKIKDL